MNNINLQFTMAKYNHHDNILRTITEDSLNFLFKHLNTRRIKYILLTGSIANGEGTVIEYDSFLITSDFDFIIYMDFPYYLISRNIFRTLSHEMSKKIKERGIETHVTYIPTTTVFNFNLFPMKSRIYKYEFARSSKCVYGIASSFNKFVYPSKNDALELVFTVIGDQIFSEYSISSRISEIYIYAKRVLTLLYSLLIFSGYPCETYQKRLKIAKKFTHNGIIPINKDEIRSLSIFTQFKLTGSIQYLLDSFSFKDVNDLIKFQKEFLNKFTIIVLYYELINIYKNSRYKNMIHSIFFHDTTKYFQLIKQYLKYSKIKFCDKIIGIFLYVLLSLLKINSIKELFATFIFIKRSPKNVLNALVMLLFFYGCDEFIEIKIKKTFSWIDFENMKIPETIYKLWRTAEQTIKLV